MLNTKTYIALLLATLSGPCAATVYELSDPVQSVLGVIKASQTVYEDTLYDLARRYSLGSEGMIRVNPQFDPWLPGADKTVLIRPPHPAHRSARRHRRQHREHGSTITEAKRHQPQAGDQLIRSASQMDGAPPLGETG